MEAHETETTTHRKGKTMNGPTNNPETNALFAEYAKAIRESFDLDNDTIPAEYRDNRSKRTSLDFIERRHKKLNSGPTAHEIEKAEKARRVEQYAAQLEMRDVPGSEPELVTPFEYDVDEDKQYRAELQFCAGAVRAGWMTFEDEE